MDKITPLPFEFSCFKKPMQTKFINIYNKYSQRITSKGKLSTVQITKSLNVFHIHKQTVNVYVTH